MGAAFLITLRDGVEAALIIAIVMAYLRQLGRGDQFPPGVADALGGGASGVCIATAVRAARYP